MLTTWKENEECYILDMYKCWPVIALKVPFLFSFQGVEVRGNHLGFFPSQNWKNSHIWVDSDLFFFLQTCHSQGNNNSNLLMAPTVERIHVSASNPNLLTHCANDLGKPDSPLNSPHENKIQEIRLRENYVATAENGEWAHCSQRFTHKLPYINTS